MPQNILQDAFSTRESDKLWACRPGGPEASAVKVHGGQRVWRHTLSEERLVEWQQNVFKTGRKRGLQFVLLHVVVHAGSTKKGDKLS
jgi:hypothetical protein